VSIDREEIMKKIVLTVLAAALIAGASLGGQILWGDAPIASDYLVWGS
jgi:hypothetical protein